MTSGNAVTICCCGESAAPFLNSKSPIARDSARLPLTRPSSTKPPAASMRAFSPTDSKRPLHHDPIKVYLPSFTGLWSNDSGFARPLTPRTDLESPAFACNRSICFISTMRIGANLPHIFYFVISIQPKLCTQILLPQILGLYPQSALEPF